MSGVAPSSSRSTVRIWWQLSLLGGALLTAVDAFLLQEKKAFFTGGFLSTDYARGPGDAAAFLAVSLATDTAIVAVAMAVALWGLARIPLTRTARGLTVLLVALTPLLIANFLSYRLAAYLGDAFDLALLFDLTGRQPGEMFAVAAPHLVKPGLAVIALCAAAAALVWAVNRMRRGTASTLPVPPRVFLLAVAGFLAALAVTTTLRARSDMIDNGVRRKPTGKLLAWVVRAATDVDRDGHGVGGFLDDPAPFDARFFPYAVDLPGNGIDENGVGGDLPAGSLPYVDPPASTGTWQQRPDVVLFVLESFRADAVGAMVNGRPVTPVLDELGASGVSAKAVFSHNGYTTQSRFHLMSGSLVDLGARRTLIDDFKDNGYETGYFSGQDESFGALSVGFERADVAYDARQDKERRYTTFTTAGSLAVPFDVVRERIAAFIERRDRTRPLFLYVNFHDTHYPYHHAGMRPLVSEAALPEAQIGPRRQRELRDTYANAAANVDRAIGETLTVIRRHLSAPPAVIVTADHGESLFDEGFLGHGYALNDAQTRIPLIVNGLPLTIEEPFGQIELRGAIGRALSAPASAGTPQVVPRAGKKVFQYLGNLDRPRQIAFAEGASRTIYDFRTRQVQTGGTWRDPNSLGPEASRILLELVRFWERVVLARGNVQRGPDE